MQTTTHEKKDPFKGKFPLLFNLDEDPSEKYNLSDDYPEKVNELLEFIRQQEEEREAIGTFWDKNPL